MSENALEPMTFNSPSGEVKFYRHGAHVAHYQPRGHEPVLFVSARSFYEFGKPIRGGIPVVFPWFGPRDGDKTAMHGVARTRAWDIANTERVGEAMKTTLRLASSRETRAIWDHDFDLTLAVTVGEALTMEMTVRNTSASDFTFEEALHTYYTVGDVRRVSLHGLTGATYIDKTVSPEAQVDRAHPLTFDGPIDRVYSGTAATCVIEDPLMQRRIVIEKQNANSTIVWNPWADRIGGFVDLAAEEWTKFLCVESGNVRRDAVRLAAGQSHTMTLRISTAKL